MPTARATSPADDVAERPTRAFELAIAHIEELILSGQLKVGEKLPPERELAGQLGLSRPAVREAIRTLEAQGVLASHTGSGARAGTTVINDRSHSLGRLLRLQVALAQFPLDEVMATRIALERAACGLAAQFASDEGLVRLQQLVTLMDDHEDPQQFNELDTRFHVSIAHLGGNRMIADLTSAIRESLRLPILEAEERLEGWSDLRLGLQREHHAIADALAQRDADLASELIEAHIRRSYASLPIKLLGDD